MQKNHQSNEPSFITQLIAIFQFNPFSQSTTPIKVFFQTKTISAAEKRKQKRQEDARKEEESLKKPFELFFQEGGLYNYFTKQCQTLDTLDSAKVKRLLNLIHKPEKDQDLFLVPLSTSHIISLHHIIHSLLKRSDNLILQHQDIFEDRSKPPLITKYETGYQLPIKLKPLSHFKIGSIESIFLKMYYMLLSSQNLIFYMPLIIDFEEKEYIHYDRIVYLKTDTFDDFFSSNSYKESLKELQKGVDYFSEQYREIARQNNKSYMMTKQEIPVGAWLIPSIQYFSEKIDNITELKSTLKQKIN